jgi:hypothetical protein
MKHEHHNGGYVRGHEEISSLLPWYLNGTIGEHDRQRIDAHLRECATCREELRQESRVHQAMAAESGVEYMPAASLKRLQARLDGLGGGTAQADAPADSVPRRRSPRRSMPWRGWMAASIVAVSMALGAILADQWTQFRARELSFNYHTVTTAPPRAPEEVIRAVFSPTITLVELQAILDEAQLRIISGPTEAGVYSLAAKSGRPVSSSLALLRRHAAVRFAESTQPDAKTGMSRGSE